MRPNRSNQIVPATMVAAATAISEGLCVYAVNLQGTGLTLIVLAVFALLSGIVLWAAYQTRKGTIWESAALGVFLGTLGFLLIQVIVFQNTNIMQLLQ